MRRKNNNGFSKFARCFRVIFCIPRYPHAQVTHNQNCFRRNVIVSLLVSSTLFSVRGYNFLVYFIRVTAMTGTIKDRIPLTAPPGCSLRCWLIPRRQAVNNPRWANTKVKKDKKRRRRKNNRKEDYKKFTSVSWRSKGCKEWLIARASRKCTRQLVKNVIVACRVQRIEGGGYKEETMV